MNNDLTELKNGESNGISINESIQESSLFTHHLKDLEYLILIIKTD